MLINLIIKTEKCVVSNSTGKVVLNTLQELRKRKLAKDELKKNKKLKKDLKKEFIQGKKNPDLEIKNVEW